MSEWDSLKKVKKKCKSAVFKKDTDRKEGQQNKTARRIHVTIYPSVRLLERTRAPIRSISTEREALECGETINYSDLGGNFY